MLAKFSPVQASRSTRLNIKCRPLPTGKVTPVAVSAIPGAVSTLESGSSSLSSRMAWRTFLDWSHLLL